MVISTAEGESLNPAEGVPRATVAAGPGLAADTGAGIPADAVAWDGVAS